MLSNLHSLCVALVLALPLGGCMSSDQMEAQLKTRAAFDLDCPADSVDVQEIDGTAMGASGCGKRATYLPICNAFSCAYAAQGHGASDARQE